MSKILKVQDDVYLELDGLRGGRLTFSEVIDLLLDMRQRVVGLVHQVEGSPVLPQLDTPAAGRPAGLSNQGTAASVATGDGPDTAGSAPCRR